MDINVDEDVEGAQKYEFPDREISYTEFLVRRRQYISPLWFQLVPPLVTMSPWLPVLPIFVNIHMRIKYLRESNGAPVMIIPVTIVKRKLLSMPNYDKWSLAGGIFSLNLLQYFKLLLLSLFSQVPYYFYIFISLGSTLQIYFPLFLVYLVPPVILNMAITTPFIVTPLVGLSSLPLWYFIQ